LELTIPRISVSSLDGMRHGLWPVNVAHCSVMKCANCKTVRHPAQAILDGKYPVPRGISSEGRDLVRRLFAKRADDRISVAQIKRHPWFLQNLPDELSVCADPGTVQVAHRLDTSCVMVV